MAVLLGAKPPIPTAQFVIGESKTFTAPMTGTIKVIITGGDSIFLSGNLKNTIFTNSNFIYRGLNYLIEYNQVNE